MPHRELPPALADVDSFSAVDAVAAGMTYEQLRRRGIRRVSQGRYTTKSLDFTGRCRALLPLLPAGSCFSDLTAARLWNLPLPLQLVKNERAVHISVRPCPTVPRRRELIFHRRSFNSDDIHVHEGLPLMGAARTLGYLARSLSVEELVAMGDQILRRSLSTMDELRDALTRRLPGIIRARHALPLMSPLSQSAPESVLRLRLRAVGLDVIPQVPVITRDGNIAGHADLGIVGAKVAIEYEGRQHASGEQFDYDIDRYSEFAACGWLVLRAGPRDLAHESRRLIARVKAACASRTTVEGAS